MLHSLRVRGEPSEAGGAQRITRVELALTAPVRCFDVNLMAPPSGISLSSHVVLKVERNWRISMGRSPEKTWLSIAWRVSLYYWRIIADNFAPDSSHVFKRR